MCCFSGAVDTVADTRIFARRHNSRQFLVYSMTYAADTELAMVLPLPVPPNTPDGGVRFINLERYPRLLDDITKGFAPIFTRSLGLLGGISIPDRALAVHDVGNFEASFVPHQRDFDRLDERFRISPVVWDQIPEYHDYGFAVFKLKRTVGWWKRHGRVHPMAFVFPQRDRARLYFPTVHVHDGTFQAEADFDHVLIYQSAEPLDVPHSFAQKSDAAASAFVDVERTHGIVDADQYCWRVFVNGRLLNKDCWLGAGGYIPVPARVS
jgi:hypothetical protein